MVTVAGIVQAVDDRLVALEEGSVVALTDPNVAGERAAFERGRLAGLRDARREVRRAYKKETEEES